MRRSVIDSAAKTHSRATRECFDHRCSTHCEEQPESFAADSGSALAVRKGVSRHAVVNLQYHFLTTHHSPLTLTRARSDDSRVTTHDSLAAALALRRERVRTHQRLRGERLEVGDLPVHDVHVAMCATRELGIVRDHDDRRSATVDVFDQIHDLTRHQRIEVARRLVGKQKAGRTGERSRNRDTLLLPARQLRRECASCARRAPRAREPP